MTDEFEVGKMVVVLNHEDEQSVMAALVMSAAIVATGEQVLMFFQPGAARMLVKGELEKLQGLKGQPDPLDLYEAILMSEKAGSGGPSISFAAVSYPRAKASTEVIRAITTNFAASNLSTTWNALT